MTGRNNKKLFWAALGYVAGAVVASMYTKKTGNTLRKDLNEAKEKGEGCFKVLAGNFVQVHSNLLDNLKEEIMTEENIAMFNEHKEDLIKLIDSYKDKGLVLLKDLQKKGEGYLAESQVKLKELYNEKIEEINELKGLAPQKAQELKTKLKAAFEELQEEMKNLVKK